MPLTCGSKNSRLMAMYARFIDGGLAARLGDRVERNDTTPDARHSKSGCRLEQGAAARLGQSFDRTSWLRKN
jgi:hypothetical protein